VQQHEGNASGSERRFCAMKPVLLCTHAGVANPRRLRRFHCRIVQAAEALPGDHDSRAGAVGFGKTASLRQAGAERNPLGPGDRAIRIGFIEPAEKPSPSRAPGPGQYTQGWTVARGVTLTVAGFGVRAVALFGMIYAAQLYIGLYRNPSEWPWEYVFIIVISWLFHIHAAGRSLGLDALLRRETTLGKSDGILARLYRWAS
jgi:hypothetical protein